MERLQLLVGLCLLAASVIGFYFALPQDGKPPRFLKNDQVQSYFTVAIISFFLLGGLFTLAGLTDFEAFSAYK